MTARQLKKFNTRTYSLWSSQNKRLEKTTGKWELEVPWTLGWFRIEVDKLLSQPSDRRQCPYCKTPLTITTLSLDHRIPVERAEECLEVLKTLAARPSKELINHKDAKLLAFFWSNYDFVCKTCNRRKGSLTHYEFRQLLSLLTTMSTSASRYVLTKLSSVPFTFWRKGSAKKDGETVARAKVLLSAAKAAGGLF